MSVTCQVCKKQHTMKRVLSLGYMPPPNEMKFNHDPQPQTWLPTEMWYCDDCELAQLGYVPDRSVSFPYDYPYTSGATPALKRNFEELASRLRARGVTPADLVIDIGSNDGTLLSCFGASQRVVGIEPTRAAELATKAGINTKNVFFTSKTANSIVAVYGKAKAITCTNCFAHMPDIHDVIEGVKTLLTDDGWFVTESHYLVDLVKTLQYDTIYAEHLRYYTIRSLSKLLEAHGLRIVDVEHTKIHGGSIRVYAKKAPCECLYIDMFDETVDLAGFAKDVQRNKLALLNELHTWKSLFATVVGIGAPSRAATVINYCGLDASIIDYVCEQPHSLKIGRFMPGTDIPVVDEARLYQHPQPAAAILFSWHLADELIPKLRAKGFHGEIILPCSVTCLNENAEAVA